MLCEHGKAQRRWKGTGRDGTLTTKGLKQLGAGKATTAHGAAQATLPANRNMLAHDMFKKTIH